MYTGVPTVKQTAVYVYQTPVRIWHWVNALAITVLAITGYLIPESVFVCHRSSITC